MDRTLREYLSSNKLITDGAFGTYFSTLCQDGMFPERANTQAPELVRKVHRAYIEAGAGLIRTNTFASNTESLGCCLSDVLANVRAAFALAKEAAGGEAYIAGDIGPLMAGRHENEDEIKKEYLAIAREFIRLGADAIVFETFSDTDPVLAVADQLRRESDIFLWLQFSVNQLGYSNAGISARTLFCEASAAGALDAVGFNCGVGPAHLGSILNKLNLNTGKYISALPNAGYPKIMQGRVVFLENIDYFTERMTDIALSGASIVGGCCGTSPDYIREFKERLTQETAEAAGVCAADNYAEQSADRSAEMQHPQDGGGVSDATDGQTINKAGINQQEPLHGNPTGSKSESAQLKRNQSESNCTKLSRSRAVKGHCNISSGGDRITKNIDSAAFFAAKGLRIAARKENNAGKENTAKLIAVELSPPPSADDEKLMDAAHLLEKTGVDVVTFPDSPSGRTRADSILMAAKVARETNLCVMPHVCCRDKNAIAMRSQLLGAYLSDIRNLLIITGDPVPTMVRSDIKGVFNFDSVGLMKVVQEMNRETFLGESMHYGGAINQNRLNLEAEISRVKKKMAAGAEFFLTQPIFTRQEAERVRTLRRETGARILCGIMPLVSRKNALFIKNEMSGMNVTDEIVARYENAKTREEGQAVGIRLAKDIMQMTEDFADGYYFSIPFNRVTMLAPILDTYF